LIHYAVKANDDDAFVQYMINKGHKFDCASKKEMEKVLSLGGQPQDIIFAHPVKNETHL
jgi:ornithine decarboxylase